MPSISKTWPSLSACATSNDPGWLPRMPVRAGGYADPSRYSIRVTSSYTGPPVEPGRPAEVAASLVPHGCG